MIVHGIYCLKPYKDRKLSFLANWLHSKHISANSITMTGLICGLLAACWLWAGWIGWGLTFIMLSIFADILDGTVARVGRGVSFQGQLFDSISDRIVEIAWIGALIYIGFLPWWGIALPLGSMLLLFNRFWAYHHEIDTSFILIARFERMAAVLGIIIFPRHWLTSSFFLLVALGTLVANLFIIKAILSQCLKEI
jgi:phosphatidylglycerophosphate synthase